jgi:hypothetical protein
MRGGQESWPEAYTGYDDGQLSLADKADCWLSPVLTKYHNEDDE